MSEIVLNLPTCLQYQIYDFMWGNLEIYRSKMNNCLNCLVDSSSLFPVNDKKINGKNYTEMEDNLYCPECGEKTRDPFTIHICWDCQKKNQQTTISYYTNSWCYVNNHTLNFV